MKPKPLIRGLGALLIAAVMMGIAYLVLLLLWLVSQDKKINRTPS